MELNEELKESCFMKRACVCVGGACRAGMPADQSGLRHGEEEMGRWNTRKAFSRSFATKGSWEVGSF